MPQLVIEDFLPQLVWLAITFTALYVVMARIALPRIGGVIEDRRDKIADDLEAADRFKRDAEDALTAYEESLADARAKALAIAGETRAKVTAENDAEKAKVEADLEKQIADAEGRIAQTRNDAMANVSTVAKDITAALTAELGVYASDAQVDAAVGAANS